MTSASPTRAAPAVTARAAPIPVPLAAVVPPDGVPIDSTPADPASPDAVTPPDAPPAGPAPATGRRRSGRADPRNAGDIYRAHAPAILGYLRAQRAANPEDLLGEVFLQVVRDLHRFRGDEDALRRWVFTIAHHRLVDEGRRRRRRPRLSGAPVPDVAAPAEAPGLVDPQLIAALGRLTAHQREVVALRFVADLPIEAVAKVTRRSPGAVKALQHRALDRLAEILGQ